MSIYKQPNLNTMKKITLVIIVCFLITGCSKTFIQVFETSTTNTKTQDNCFFYENDTVKITYTFWAKSGVMAFSVFNKTEKPLYLDWRNSSFIYNGNKMNYWIDEAHTDLVGFYGRNYYKEVEQHTSSSTVKPERVTFIPPKSSFKKSSFYLLQSDFYQVFIRDGTKVSPRNDNPNRQTTVYSEDFSYDKSPIKFRNYLAFSFSENSQQFFFVDNEFYLSSIKEMDYRHFLGMKLGFDQGARIYEYEYPFRKQNSFYSGTYWIPTQQN